MGGSYDSYKAAMQDPWRGWWIAWPLSQRISVGDVFNTSGGTLSSAGDLAGRAISFDSARGAPPGNFTYDSNGSVSIRFKSAGSIPEGFSALAEMDAGALVEFDRETSVLAVYVGLTQQGFSDSRSVAADLACLYWGGHWDTGLVAVRDVVSAKAGMLLIATRRGASAELRATSSAAVGPLTLADLAGNVSFARSTHVGLRWAGSGVTPFYRVVRLRRTWLNRIRTAYGPRQPGRGAAPESIPPLILAEANDDPASVIETVAEIEQPRQVADTHFDATSPPEFEP